MTKKADVTPGDVVQWAWGSGTGTGEVTKVHKSDVEKKIKGNQIKRKASKAEPAVEVKTEKGGKVLKSTSEVKIKSKA